MGYAEEREYKRAEKAIAVLDYIHKHGSIEIDQAMRVAGASRVTIWRILLDIERVCATVRRERRANGRAVWVHDT